MIKNERYNNWFTKFKNNDPKLNLLYIFINKREQFSMEELKVRFDEK